MSLDHLGAPRPPRSRPSRFRGRTALGVCVASFGGMLALVGSGATGAVGDALHRRTTPARIAPLAEAEAAGAYSKLPLSFEPNVGQAESGTRFVSRGGGYALTLSPTRAVLALSPTSSSPTEGIQARGESPTRLLGMTLVGADPSAAMTADRPLPGTVNYLSGNDPSLWHVGVPTYRGVTATAVYPGVDLSWYGSGGALEYDFRLAPGADPSPIRVDFEGARNLSLAPNGDLDVETATGTVVQQAPKVHQDIDGNRRAVDGRYVLTGEHQIGFALGAYDRSHGLIIDPVLAYSTYLGGNGLDVGNDIVVDSTGAAYVTGQTASTNFPTANPLQAAMAGPGDAFVTKLNPAGSALAYSTYLGGTSDDSSNDIAVDASGAAYVGGDTNSSDFPTVNAFQAAGAGNLDAFVTKLNPAGSALAYSTYLGGTGVDLGSGVAVDATGTVYVTGQTTSPDFPLANALQPDIAGGVDAFVTTLNAAGTALVYSTYLGGTAVDVGSDVAVGPAGAAGVTGFTLSGDFPTASPVQAAYAGNADAFVAQLNSSGSALIQSTYLGGTTDEAGFGIAVDAAGAAYVAGYTGSTDYPTANPLQGAYAGGYDAIVAKIAPTTPSTTTTTSSTTTTSTTIPGLTCLGRAATIVGTPRNDRLVGTPGADVIMGLDGNDSIQGLGGNDVICGGIRNDVLDGGAGADTIDGEAGVDRVIGGQGPDDVRGGGGSDTIFGNAGNDQVTGGAGVDSCDGGTGTNTFATCEIFP